MVFFEEQQEPYIINHLTSVKTIQRWCDTHSIFLNVGADNSTFWAGFSNWYGQTNGLSYIEAGSFSYMVSMFMTGMGVSCGTEIYFREDDIEYHLLGVLESLKSEGNDEEDIARKMFFAIFDLYKNDIEKYSFKVNHLTFRLSQSDYDRFMGVEGKDKVSKLRTLMRNYYKID